MYQPIATILAGPNGAGKSTLLEYWRPTLDELTIFILPDEDARKYQDSGHSLFTANLRAGFDAVRRFRELLNAPRSFLQETTLADGSWQRKLHALRHAGYKTEVIFLALPDPTLAVARVEARVRGGGHPVPSGKVRRRWDKSITSFFGTCRHAVDTWQFFDNGGRFIVPVAAGNGAGQRTIYDHELWREYLEIAAAAGLTVDIDQELLDDPG